MMPGWTLVSSNPPGRGFREDDFRWLHEFRMVEVKPSDKVRNFGNDIAKRVRVVNE